MKSGVQEEEAAEKFVEMIHRKEALIVDKDEKLDTVARATGMNIYDNKSFQDELIRMGSAPGSIRKRNFDQGNKSRPVTGNTVIRGHTPN